jgi:hypothetical protein
VVLEEDGRTCYAYLRESGRILSDVWLYNRPGQPDAPRWDDADELPFANRKRNILEGEALRLDGRSEVACEWDARGVSVLIDGVLTARLEQDARPGWSRLVAADSPLARRLGRAPRSGR